jgi:hypothetical protein
MRAYKFLNSHFGLKSLYERRLKLSRLDELNDPFELTPFDLTNPNVREPFLKTKADLGADRGMLCFSASWCDPVIWAHYSDRHEGLCLGFEIPEMKGEPENDESHHVCYVPKPLQFPLNFENLLEAERLAIVQQILFTKYKSWNYEQEIRLWAPLQNEENGTHYFEFDEEKLRLVQVIIGAKSKFTKAAINRALGTLAGKVNVIRAQAAYDRFMMIECPQ